MISLFPSSLGFILTGTHHVFLKGLPAQFARTVTLSDSISRDSRPMSFVAFGFSVFGSVERLTTRGQGLNNTFCPVM